MSDTGKRAWRFYLDDMISCSEKVLAYTDGFSQSAFVSDGLTYDATLRNLELIGEAATHIPDEIKSLSDNIPWRMIIATRNRLIHGYLGIDNDTVWSIVTEEVPELLSKLKSLKRDSWATGQEE